MTIELIASINIARPIQQTSELMNNLLSFGIKKIRFNCIPILSDNTSFDIDTFNELINSKQFNENIEYIFDLPIPRDKIRLGNFPEHMLKVSLNQKLLFKSSPISNSCDCFIPINYNKIGTIVKPGSIITYGDGSGTLVVAERLNDTSFIALALNNFMLYEQKGLYLGFIPTIDNRVNCYKSVIAKLSILKPKYIALSFIEEPSDVLQIRSILKEEYISANIISKIETSRGAENSNAIADVSDIVMIARGDLCVTTPIENIEILQNNIIRNTKYHQKCIYVSTHIVESLRFRPIPYPSEVIDIRELIKMNVDGLVLSTGVCQTNDFQFKLATIKNIIAKQDKL